MSSPDKWWDGFVYGAAFMAWLATVIYGVWSISQRERR